MVIKIDKRKKLKQKEKFLQILNKQTKRKMLVTVLIKPPQQEQVVSTLLVAVE